MVRVEVCNIFLPVSCWDTWLAASLVRLLQQFGVSQLAQLPLSDGVNNRCDEAVFLKLKVPLLDIIEELWASSFGNEECCCSAATLESDLRCIL